MIYLFVILGFTAGFLLVFGVNLFIADVTEERRRKLHDQRLEEMRMQQLDRARESLRYKDLSQLAAETNAEAAETVTFWQRFVKMIDQSGMRIKPAQLVMLSAAAGLVPALSTFFIFWNWMISVPLLIVGSSLPVMIVSWQRNQRREKLLSQLPDAYDLMSRVLRAGQTMSHALPPLTPTRSSGCGNEATANPCERLFVQ